MEFRVLELIEFGGLRCLRVQGYWVIDFWVEELRLMDKILHDPKDPKLWELWYIPYNG